jgi:hypothetical protein
LYDAEWRADRHTRTYSHSFVYAGGRVNGLTAGP